MKIRHLIVPVIMIAALALCSACGSGSRKHHPVMGTNHIFTCEPILPEAVLQEMKSPNPGSPSYECVLQDSENDVTVWNLMRIPGTEDHSYSGIAIRKGGVITGLPYVVHGYFSSARFDSKTGILWYSGTGASGTGIHKEELYRIEFDASEAARVTCHIEPIPIQERFIKGLTYTVRDSVITLWKDDAPLFETNAMVEGLGEYDREAVWIGDQIRYDISGTTPSAILSPGVRFVSGPVLSYEGMPDLRAELDIKPDSWSFVIINLRTVN